MTKPGLGLLLTDSAIELVQLAEEMARDAHLDVEDFLTTPTCSIPIPDYDLRNGKRWPGVNPQALWHPLFWLPRTVTQRRELAVAEGHDTFVEEDSSLAARIALVLDTSGLYDPEDGTWLDILSVYGLDIDNPETVSRIDAWLGGESDETLDRIDLRALTDVVDEVNKLGLDIAVAAEDAGIKYVAEDAIEIIEELFDPTEDVAEIDQRVCIALISDALTAVMPRWISGRFSDARIIALDVNVPAEVAAEALTDELNEVARQSEENAAAFEDMISPVNRQV